MAIVFSDLFTVGTDINIDAYPSGSPDYAYARNSGAAIIVNAANDRAEIAVADATAVARIIDAVVPTGDQEITATVEATAGGDSSYVVVRAATNSYYAGYIDLSTPGSELVLNRRIDATTSVALKIEARTLSAGAHTMRLKATGTNPVLLELQIDGGATLTHSDSDATRLTSGTSGFGGYSFTGSTVWVDNLSVDDLIVTAISAPRAGFGALVR